MSKKILLTLALVSVLILAAACDDDDDCVDCPPPTEAPDPTMANIWPHDDGTAWTFDIEYREVLPPADPDKAGEIPSMEELHAALQDTLAGEVLGEGDGLFRFAFDGMVTTESEATGQNVVETIYVEMPGRPVNSGNGNNSGMDPVLAMIARARPDLRSKILARYGLDEKALDELFPPMFLGGYAFAYEDTGYFGYGDLDQEHSWVYLEGDLSVGSEFSLQLVPSLADDIWLYGQVWSIADQTVGGRTFENVVEYMYLIEMGETEIADDNGNALGSAFPYNYGYTFYAPEVGPISGVERHVPNPEIPPAEPELPIAEYVLDLVGVTFPE